MLVLVVIPLYNKENYIQNTIESALNQTFTRTFMPPPTPSSPMDILKLPMWFADQKKPTRRRLFLEKSHNKKKLYICLTIINPNT